MSVQESPERGTIPENAPIAETVIIPFRAELLKAGWCEGEIAGFMADANIPNEKRKSRNLAMLSATVSPRRHFDHSSCSLTGCQAKTAQSAPKHACCRAIDHICNCPCPSATTDTVELAAIINGNSTPLLKWEDERLEVVKDDGHTPYVAISHV
jgi:hypothetical protein